MIDDLRPSGLLAEADLDRFFHRGHFAYESGDHGDTWLALGLLFVEPRRLRAAAGRLAERLGPYAPEVVCGPLVGGALVGQWVAHDLGIAFVYAEPWSGGAAAGTVYRVPPELRPALRGKRAVVVDDAINAGAATLAGIREVRAAGGEVVAAGALLVRAWCSAGLPTDLGVAVESLLAVPWNTWPASACPLCAANVPLER